jgi:hypothetical protein
MNGDDDGERSGVGMMATVEPEDFPLVRHPDAVVALDESLNMPWEMFFGARRRSEKGVEA